MKMMTMKSRAAKKQMKNRMPRDANKTTGPAMKGPMPTKDGRPMMEK